MSTDTRLLNGDNFDDTFSRLDTIPTIKYSALCTASRG